MIKLRLNLDGFTYPGKNKAVLGALELAVPKGAIWSIVGPSGCGKTTILRILAGLLQLENGSAEIDGVPYNSLVEVNTPSEVGFFFQECDRSLLPWLNVRENISWAVRKKGVRREERDRTVNDKLKETELADFFNKFPHELSGGLKQRLGLARVLAHRPEVLLLDEPCVSLDIFARRKLELLLRRLWQKYQLTVLLVTHEIEEAIYLSQRIIMITDSPCTVVEEVPVELKDRSYTSSDFENVRRKVLSVLEDCLKCQRSID